MSRGFGFVRREAKAETRAFCKDSGLMSKENDARACRTVGKLSTVPSDGSSSRKVGKRLYTSALPLGETISFVRPHLSSCWNVHIRRKQFLNQPCTARTLPSSGKSAPPARESSSLKITSAQLAANA